MLGRLNRFTKLVVNGSRAFSAIGREPLLFTPGPLTTSHAVKQAMQVDLGSRDNKFLEVVSTIHTDLLSMAHVSQEKGYECVLVQGSGSYAVEATIQSAIPRKDSKLLIVSNGAYGIRIGKFADYANIDHTMLEYSEVEVPVVEDIVKAIQEDSDITHIAMIHHETTAGNINPIHEVGLAIKEINPELVYIVDSMSAFGAYDVDMIDSKVDYLVSSANKNIEGVPGFAFVLAKRDLLEETKGNCGCLTLDLYDQWTAYQKNGQFRFTPPTHTLLAFRQALDEHTEEGGVEGRYARYNANFQTLKKGFAEMGFHPLLDEDKQGCIITTFLFPEDPNFDFPLFYKSLSDLGIVIYPGKLTKADCFRIGSIGRLFEKDMEIMLMAVKKVLTDMDVSLPVKQITPPY
eukprot:TRINITY_DN780090_c0_g1_i1.p1 TRINITY_DN780090_c0_g1~~TRINITY_DN780090_c0_g1_i1.p1  ORF type:complete len:403 (+),score=100.18 TRINITY_DN780090_c0_g1_i1:54-1262(+)